ncbi:hypothetical protein [uncultured Thiodictyon sp.]|jgi:hypothetical protein|uniref:hypothetical protein n=1 Tax=uncultured Thiodictyon sp. TaxID=1846217 RepID=UPI0025DE2F3F|nr:hypothetical protein [uncultured Thiodictyon sp.]
MHVATGTVVSGKVVLDQPGLDDGTGVYVLTRNAPAAPKLSTEELAELEAGLAEADRDETIAGAEFLAQLRRHG